MERKEEIENLIKQIDLTPAMYDNAVNKYKALGDFLQSSNSNIDFYPQGSFVLGTTVRPYRKMEEREYDLDAICLNNVSADNAIPKNIYSNLKNILSSSKVYSNNLSYYSRCITINYADYGNIGFNIDVVPSAKARKISIDNMIKGECPYQYIETAIEVAEIEDERNRWISSNPKAYARWFKEINEPFIRNIESISRQSLFESNRNIYNSIEEVPEYFVKSSLQKAIQLLKRARDVYFSQINKEDKKPISAIISTFVLDIAKNIPQDSDVIMVTQFFINQLKEYSNYLNESFNPKDLYYMDKVVITRKNSRWEMKNPVNPNDNLVDSWNEDSEKATLFFKWVNSLEKTLNSIFDESNIHYKREFSNLFGNKLVERNYNVPVIKNIGDGPRPWKANY